MSDGDFNEYTCGVIRKNIAELTNKLKERKHDDLTDSKKLFEYVRIASQIDLNYKCLRDLEAETKLFNWEP